MADAATQAQPVATPRAARPAKSSSFEEFGQLLRFSLSSLRDTSCPMAGSTRRTPILVTSDCATAEKAMIVSVRPM